MTTVLTVFTHLSLDIFNETSLSGYYILFLPPLMYTHLSFISFTCLDLHIFRVVSLFGWATTGLMSQSLVQALWVEVVGQTENVTKDAGWLKVSECDGS